MVKIHCCGFLKKRSIFMSKLSGISFKMTSLVLALSLTSFLGFSLLILNGIRFQNISHELTEQYNDSLARESFSQFNEFLNTTEAISGLSLEIRNNVFLPYFFILFNTMFPQLSTTSRNVTFD